MEKRIAAICREHCRHMARTLPSVGDGCRRADLDPCRRWMAGARREVDQMTPHEIIRKHLDPDGEYLGIWADNCALGIVAELDAHGHMARAPSTWVEVTRIWTWLLWSVACIGAGAGLTRWLS